MGFKTVYMWKTIFWSLWSTSLLAQASPWTHKCWDGLPVSSLLLDQSILPLLVGTATLLTASPTPPTHSFHLQEDTPAAGEAKSGVPILSRDPKFQSVFSQHGHGALFPSWNPLGWGLDTPYIFLFLTHSSLNHASNLMYTYFQEGFFHKEFFSYPLYQTFTSLAHG